MQRGFTLLELIIVLAVIAVIAAFAMSSYQNYQIRQNREMARYTLYNAAINLEKYYLLHGTYLLANGEAPANLFESEVIGSSGVVYRLKLIADRQTFSILAMPESQTIQANDGSIYIDRQGNIDWPVSYK